MQGNSPRGDEHINSDIGLAADFAAASVLQWKKGVLQWKEKCTSVEGMVYFSGKNLALNIIVSTAYILLNSL